MPQTTREILEQFTAEIKNIYGTHLTKVILFGSYARGDFNDNSDIDIMILLDISESAADEYDDALSNITFDYNVDNDLYIMPIVKSESHFKKWVDNYPFYANVNREGVVLYGAA